MPERKSRSPRTALTERAREFANPGTPLGMRALNVLTGPFSRQLWKMDPEALKRTASKKTGLSVFDDLAPLDEPLEILCRALNTQPGLHSMGRLSVRHILVENLVNRLRIQDLVSRRPEVLDEPIERPLFVTGVNRSGTTFLQRLLSRDPQLRGIPFWQAMSPLPSGPLDQPVPDPDPRIAGGATALKFTYWRAPDLVYMHEMVNDEPDEEIPILAMGFAAPLFQYMAVLPEFCDWYDRADHTDGYRYFRRTLQVMQWLQPGGRWVLKSPSHLEVLPALLAAFDDATVIQTHRDPATAVVSLASLVVYGQRANLAHPDPHAIGAWCADLVERMVRNAIRDRAAAGAGDRFVDVHFRELIAEPIEQVKRVYEVAGLKLSGQAERNMRDWIEREKPKQGRHSYAAEDFNLDVAALRERFAFYYQHFGVPVDER